MSFTAPAFTGSRKAFSNMVFVPVISVPFTVLMERSEDGTVKIEGQFVKVNAPSESLMKRLRGNGVPKSKLELYGRVPA